MNKAIDKSFSKALLNWFEKHGRHDLPWQHPREPYRVWLSEIMLQQTQVQTVIPYFERFIAEFKDIEALANASQDEVLHLWTGLGYYARARNLHKAAQTIVEQHQGIFPENYEEIIDLPGIGPSTAAAILAQAFEKPHAILDGNVKRVLTRYHAISGWPGEKKIEKQLWEISKLHTPDHSAADYTQAIMDLGATVCSRSQPNCSACPLSNNCLAFEQGNQTDYPTSKKRSALPVKQTTMLLLQNTQGEFLLQKRPAQGIWGNLWSLPEVDESIIIEPELFGLKVKSQKSIPAFRHTFSHFHLDIKPLLCEVSTYKNTVMESQNHVWYKGDPADKRGLPGPVKKLLESLLEN